MTSKNTTLGTEVKNGRPTVMTPLTVEKLIECFKLGMTDESACSIAKIHRDTYYKHLKDNPEFSDAIAFAKQYPRLTAGSVVMQAIESNDKESAKWWLEKKHSDEFGGKANVQATQINIELPSWAKDGD